MISSDLTERDDGPAVAVAAARRRVALFRLVGLLLLVGLYFAFAYSEYRGRVAAATARAVLEEPAAPPGPPELAPPGGQ